MLYKYKCKRNPKIKLMLMYDYASLKLPELLAVSVLPLPRSDNCSPSSSLLDRLPFGASEKRKVLFWNCAAVGEMMGGPSISLGGKSSCSSCQPDELRRDRRLRFVSVVVSSLVMSVGKRTARSMAKERSKCLVHRSKYAGTHQWVNHDAFLEP